MDRGSEAVREIASTDYGDGLEVGSHAAANLKFLLPLCALYLSITVSVWTVGKAYQAIKFWICDFIM
jgi:hypothetical protein